MTSCIVDYSFLLCVAPCVAQYGQCGGLEYRGSTECCAPSTCVYSNPWYSQCIPSAGPSPTGRNGVSGRLGVFCFYKSDKHAHLSCIGCSALYGQCGGQNWSGPTCCDYSTCIYSNPYYSQCLPDSSSSSSSSSTVTSSSSSSTTSETQAPTQTSSSSSSTSSTNRECIKVLPFNRHRHRTTLSTPFLESCRSYLY